MPRESSRTRSHLKSPGHAEIGIIGVPNAGKSPGHLSHRADVRDTPLDAAGSKVFAACGH